MKLTGLVTDGLAAYRLGRLFVEEDSPVSQRARELVQQYAPAGWQGVLDCEHCAALWAALGLAGLRAIGLPHLSYPLAAAAVQSLLKDAVRPEPTQDVAVEHQGAWADPLGDMTKAAADSREAWRQGQDIAPDPRYVPLTPRPIADGTPPPADLG